MFSGELLANGLAPLCDLLGFPPELLPIAELIETHG